MDRFHLLRLMTAIALIRSGRAEGETDRLVRSSEANCYAATLKALYPDFIPETMALTHEWAKDVVRLSSHVDVETAKRHLGWEFNPPEPALV